MNGVAQILKLRELMTTSNILVPTDLGEGATEALDYACDLAADLGATVHVLNVIAVPGLGVPELGVAMTAGVIDAMVHDNQATLEKLADDRRSRVKIGKVLMRGGDARDQINEVARELDCDLIVMATHGRRGVSRVLLGSVAESVVRTAPCPVLTVRTGSVVRPRHAAA